MSLVLGTDYQAWVWPPDWASGITERWVWYTNVLTGFKGTEQRRALRIGARQELDFSTMLDADERRLMEAMIWAWGAKPWGVPLWFEGMELAATLTSGATSIPLSPAQRFFEVGGYALLIGQNTRTFEVVEITALGGSISLLAATTITWPAGTRVYPLRMARMNERVSLPRYTGGAASVALQFEMESPVAWASSPGAATYRSFPVLEIVPNWESAPAHDIERMLNSIDAGTGPVLRDDQADMPFTRQSLRFTLATRAAIDAWRQLVTALRGKQGSLWLPTQSLDIVPSASIASGAVLLDVNFCGYTAFQLNQINRRDIRIELNNGTVLYRRISAASVLSASTERLTLDSALGVTVQPAEFARISFMSLCRFDSDICEMAWWTGDIAETATAFRSYNRDV